MEQLTEFVTQEFAALNSGNEVRVKVKSIGDWWEADPGSNLSKLAEKALFKVISHRRRLCSFSRGFLSVN